MDFTGFQSNQDLRESSYSILNFRKIQHFFQNSPIPPARPSTTTTTTTYLLPYVLTQ